MGGPPFPEISFLFLFWQCVMLHTMLQSHVVVGSLNLQMEIEQVIEADRLITFPKNTCRLLWVMDTVG